MIKKMVRTTNLSRQMEKQLPAELVEFMQTAGLMAASQGHNLYLVGGVVRDLILARNNFDLDLVVEDDAISLAQRLTDTIQAKITVHRRFNTAKLRWGKWSADLTTARSETYEKPGALPRVQPGSLASDLFRRDFTINAMAIELNPTRYGQLIDLYDGREDLERGIISLLHENSFIDDATRIWRALRYEQRLDFHLEPVTLGLLKRDVPRLDTISGDRLRHELELVLKEALPEKAVCRAAELKVLRQIHPALKGDDWLSEKFGQAREISSPNPPSVELYLALLAYRLSGETEELITKLRLPGALARTLRDTVSLKAIVKVLADPDLAPSRIYSLLHDSCRPAINATSIATDSPVVRRNIQTYLSRLRYVRPALTGRDLQKMGISPGPRMKDILKYLHEARLDGKVTSKREEVNLVKEWVQNHI
ncbi:CCA tRNA nucleotidyltransferase [Chloroflexota bacterium]